jgi:dihydrofolate reductase
MGRLIVTTAMTVDAVMTVEEWFVPEGSHSDAAFAQFEGAAGMVLGRKNYVGLAGFWPTQDGPWADLLNPMPKFVASRTLQEPLEWNATLLEGDAREAVARLKETSDGDLITPGAGGLARSLLEAGLVDELRFSVHPSLWGEGERPFGADERRRLRLVGSEAFDSGVVLLRYEPAG